MRIRNDFFNQNFAIWLKKMFYDFALYDCIDLFDEIINRTQNLQHFTKFIFFLRMMNETRKNFNCFLNRAILIMHNNIVAKLNDLILNFLSKNTHTMTSVNFITNEHRQIRSFAAAGDRERSSFCRIRRICFRCVNMRSVVERSRINVLFLFYFCLTVRAKFLFVRWFFHTLNNQIDRNYAVITLIFIDFYLNAIYAIYRKIITCFITWFIICFETWFNAPKSAL